MRKIPRDSARNSSRIGSGGSPDFSVSRVWFTVENDEGKARPTRIAPDCAGGAKKRNGSWKERPAIVRTVSVTTNSRFRCFLQFQSKSSSVMTTKRARAGSVSVRQLGNSVERIVSGKTIAAPHPISPGRGAIIAEREPCRESFEQPTTSRCLRSRIPGAESTDVQVCHLPRSEYRRGLRSRDHR